MNLIQFLMTPNEVLNNFLLCMFSFLEAYLYLNFFTKLLNISKSAKQDFTFTLSIGLMGIIMKLILKFAFSDIINIILFILLVHFNYKQNIRNSFLALISSYFGIFICAYLSELLLKLFFNISINNESMTIPLYYFLSVTITYLSFTFIIMLISKRKEILNFLKLSLKSTIIINLLFGIIAIFVQSLLFSTYKDALPLNIKLLSIISLVLYFLISMHSLIRTNALEKTTADLENEKIYNKTLTLLHDNIRCFKHDFNNIVQALGGYIALNDMDGLKDYYKNLLADCKQTNNLNVLNPETINNPSIYSLLTNKYYLAQEKGINMTFTIFSDLSNINFNMYEFSRILGILLDNAIEAAQETDEKIINIEFRADAKKQLFIIANSCKDTDISTTKIFEKGFSTKANNSGIGLWKVHKILSKNTDADLFTTVNNNMFTQQLEIFYKT